MQEKEARENKSCTNIILYRMSHIINKWNSFEKWSKVDELKIGKVRTEFLFVVPFRNIRGESWGDSRVVHDVVKRRRFHRFLPQLFRLLLGEAPGSKLWTGPVQLWIRFSARLWADVVRLSGPTEQRGPPIGRNGLPVVGIGLSERARRGPDDGGLKKRECGCHRWERREEQWKWILFLLWLLETQREKEN